MWADINKIENCTSCVAITIDNTKATPLLIKDTWIYRDDGASIIASASNSIQIDPPAVFIVETGVSGLTTAESNKLLALDTSNLDAAISTRATPTNITDAQTAIIAEVDANETKIDALETKAQADARQALLIAEHDSTQSDISSLNDLSTADIDARLSAYDMPTKAEMDAQTVDLKGSGDKDLTEVFNNTPDLSSVWTNPTRTLTAGTKDAEIDAIKASTDNLPANPASTTDVTDAQAAIIAEIDANESDLTALTTSIDTLLKFHNNVTKFFGSDGTTETKQGNAFFMTVYDDDGTTPLKTIAFRNETNTPIKLSNATRYVRTV